MTKVEKSSKMEDMLRTTGWKVFQAALEQRYESAVKSLVTGCETSPEYIAAQRERCKLIRELLSVAGISKEEL